MAVPTLVDISTLPETTSRAKGIWIAVEVPGVGLRKISKENFFKLLGMGMIAQTTAGIAPTVTIDGETFGQYYLTGGSGGVGQTMFGYNKTHFSADATVSNAITIDATLRALIIRSLTGNNQTLTLDENSTGNKDGYLGTSFDQQVSYDSIAVDSTITAKRCQRSIMVIDASATIAALTINFPSSPNDGYTFELSMNGSITAITADAGLNTIDEPPTSSTGRTKGKWVFFNNVWRVL